jgi:hypothetical protein
MTNIVMPDPLSGTGLARFGIRSLQWIPDFAGMTIIRHIVAGEIKGDHMKVLKILFGAAAIFFLISTHIVAADFGWMNDFNIRAEADSSSFRARLATRFQIGDAHISAVIGNVSRPADAYMVLRLGEMANRPPEYVLDKYKSVKGKGWGALAKSLGIKPGSKEFHALKRGHDLYGRDKGKRKSKGKGKGKG